MLEAGDGLLAAWRPGTVWMEMSTTDSAEITRLGALVAAAGGAAVDCPVSGGCHRAATGNISIFAGTNGYIDSVPVDRVTEYEEQMLSYMRTEHAGVLEEIRTTGKFEDDTKNKVVDALKTFAKQFA